MKSRSLAYALLLLLLTACGGGGGGSAPITFTPLTLNNPPLAASVGLRASHYYSVDVTAGDYLRFTLKTLSGDADIAVFRNTNLDNASVLGFSANSNLADDVVTLTAPFTGTLYIEVGGFLASDYTVEVTGNAPPAISGLQLTPQPAYTNTDLHAAASFSDPEGDPYTITYTWSVNGASVTGVTGDTLPNAAFDTGDNVTVRITISDQHSTTRAIASTAISPIPISVTATPPATVDEGTPFAFRAQASDPGNPLAVLTYAVLYGPSGMQVDAGGNVTWTAHGAIFDTAADVNYAIRIRNGTSFLDYAGTVTVLDGAQQEPILRGEYSVPRSPDGFHIDDFDNDGVNEILVTDNYKHVYLLEHVGGEYIQDWMLPVDYADSGVISEITTQDINNDAYPEIILGVSRTTNSGATNEAWIFVIDGRTRQLSAQTRLAGDHGISTLVTSNTDDDASPELIALTWLRTGSVTESRIHVLDAPSLATEWLSPTLPRADRLVTGQLDADPRSEIAVSTGVIYGYDGSTYVSEWTSSSAFGPHFAAGDIDNDGIEEIITTEEVYSLPAQGVIAQVPQEPFVTYRALATGNLDADPEVELAVANVYGDVIVLDYDGATNTLVETGRLNQLNDIANSIAIGDTDTDSTPEILWSAGALTTDPDSLVVASLGPGLTAEWTNADTPQLTGSFTGGYWSTLAPGDRRAVFAVSNTDLPSALDHGPRAVTMDSGGNVAIGATILGKYRFGDTALAVTDYDRDSVDEILIGSTDQFNDFMYVYDFTSDIIEWSIPAGGDTYAIATHDVTGDGADDIVSLTLDQLLIHDALNQALVSTTTLPANILWTDLEIADIDDDGEHEFVIVDNTNTLYVYGPDGSSGYRVEGNAPLPGPNSSTYRLDIGDLDGDGTQEIVVTQAYSLNASSISVFDPALNVIASYPVPVVPDDIRIEATAEPRRNIVVAYNTDNLITPGASRLAWLDPFTGNEISRSPPLIGKVQRNSINFADINQDSQPDLLIGTFEGMYMTR